MLLNQCGYISLDEVLDERLAAFDRKPQLLQFEELMKNAMTYRRAHPACLVNPANSVDKWAELSDRFKPPYVVLQEGLVNPGGDLAPVVRTP